MDRWHNLVMRSFLLVVILGCGGSSKATIAPTAELAHTESPPGAPEASTHAQVATNEPHVASDPCEGGEVSPSSSADLADAGEAAKPTAADATRKGGGKGGTCCAIGVGTSSPPATGHGAGNGSGDGTHLAGPVQGASAPIGAGGAVTGGLSYDAINRVVVSRVEKLRSCFLKGLEQKPGLAGKITVKFTIGNTGTVTKAKSAGVDVGVDACIDAVFKAMQFPAPTDGKAVEVNYPLVLGAGG